MNISVRHHDDIVILDLKGTIDINASEFVERTGQILKRYPGNIVCNFSDVNLIDYVGISIIAIVYKNVLNHNRTLEVCNVPAHIQNLFAIVGLNKVFTYYPCEEAAIKALDEKKGTNEATDQHLRRRFRRLYLNTPVTFKQKFVQNDPIHEGKIIDLSAVGAFITSEKIFPIGEALSVTIQLGEETPALESDAKVVWVADRTLQIAALPGMGVEFLGLTQEKQEHIVAFVEKNLASSQFD